MIVGHRDEEEDGRSEERDWKSWNQINPHLLVHSWQRSANLRDQTATAR